MDISVNYSSLSSLHYDLFVYSSLLVLVSARHSYIQESERDDKFSRLTVCCILTSGGCQGTSNYCSKSHKRPRRTIGQHFLNAHADPHLTNMRQELRWLLAFDHLRPDNTIPNGCPRDLNQCESLDCLLYRQANLEKKLGDRATHPESSIPHAPTPR